MSKIIILSTSGNVGKSTIAREVLKANNNEYTLFEAEHTNVSSVDYNIDVKEIENRKELMIKIIKTKDFVLDVGSANMFDILEELEEMKILKQIDKFIVPTTSTSKEYEDATATILLLKNINIAPSKIQLLLNKVGFDEYTAAKDNGKQYLKFETFANDENIIFDKEACIYDSALFDLAAQNKKMISEYTEDETDYIEMIENEEDAEKISDYFDKHELQILSQDLKTHLKYVSDAILK